MTDTIGNHDSSTTNGVSNVDQLSRGDGAPTNGHPDDYQRLEDAYQEEIAENGRLTKENRELREQQENLEDTVFSLIDRLEKYGEDPNDLLSGGTGDDGEDIRGPLTDENPLEGCESIPDAAFEVLPRVLGKPCDYWERDHKRDVFLTSALGIISGCMPNVLGYWGADVPIKHRPNLYMAFVAGAAGGKSAGDRATKLADTVHEKIRERWKDDVEQWKEDKRDHDEDEDGPFDDPRPGKRGLWTPANTSYSHLLHTLDAQEGRGVIHSSEIDTVADALGQDWGAFDSLLRKAYHHEADDQGRRKSGTLRIEDPQISLVLGGTEQQFVSLVPSAENGLYSRLCLYYFNASDRYRSQRPSRKGIERTETLEEIGEEVAELWKVLEDRDDELQFDLKDHQWGALDDEVDSLHREVQAFGFTHLVSIPRRAALWAWRISMVLTVLQAWENDVPLGTCEKIEATDETLDAALAIATTYADHALRFARARLEDAEQKSPKDRRISAIYDGVDEQFGTDQAYAEASKFDVSDRTIRNDLKEAERRGLIRKLNRGSYEKL